jgi:hypothetical protein
MEELTKEELVGSVLLPARTSSEWDNCDAFLFEPDRDTLKMWLARMDDAALIEAKAKIEGDHNSGYHFTCYFGIPGEFKTVSEPGDWQLENYEDPVEITEELSEGLEISDPEQRIDTEMTKVTGNSVWFTGYGKHTGEEFWTSALTRSFIEELLNKLDQ